MRRLIIMAALMLTSCDRPASPPAFPQANTISGLVIDEGPIIRDRAEIDTFSAELTSINGRWTYTWDTYPSPAHMIFIYDTQNKVLCRIDFGPNWIGSNCGQGTENWPPTTDTSVKQDTFFKQFIDKNKTNT